MKAHCTRCDDLLGKVTSLQAEVERLQEQLNDTTTLLMSGEALREQMMLMLTVSLGDSVLTGKRGTL